MFTCCLNILDIFNSYLHFSSIYWVSPNIITLKSAIKAIYIHCNFLSSFQIMQIFQINIPSFSHIILSPYLDSSQVYHPQFSTFPPFRFFTSFQVSFLFPITSRLLFFFPNCSHTSFFTRSIYLNTSLLFLTSFHTSFFYNIILCSQHIPSCSLLPFNYSVNHIIQPINVFGSFSPPLQFSSTNSLGLLYLFSPLSSIPGSIPFDYLTHQPCHILPWNVTFSTPHHRSSSPQSPPPSY